MLTSLTILNSKVYGKAEIRLNDCDSLQLVGPNNIGKSTLKNMRLNFYRRNKDKHCIRMDLYKILDNYPEYRDEQTKYGNKKHYGILWREKNIYLDNTNNNNEIKIINNNDNDEFID